LEDIVGSGMTMWEYRKCMDEGELDALGRDGWELVSVLPGGTEGSAVFYFKRPAHDFREEVTLEQKRHYYKLMGVGTSSHDEGERQ
jgi:hypothetical protein